MRIPVDRSLATRAWSRSRFVASAGAALAGLGVQQYRTDRQVRRSQYRRLRGLVEYAYQNVPHYRGEWQERRLAPGDLKSIDDLARFPILERRTIAVERSRLTSRIALAGPQGQLHAMTTTGSTGTPLEIVLSSGELAHSRALAHYGHIRSGRRLSDVVAHVCVPDRLAERGHVLARLGVGRTVPVDLLEGVEANLATLERVQPDVIYGYPSYLSLLAHSVLESGGTGIQPRLVITNGEVLGPAVRSLLSSAFECEVRNSYGSVEFHQIAFGCRAQSLHVLPSVIVEVDEETVGDDGCSDILVTSLYHRTMPLIRYRLGDRIKLRKDPCACGDPLPAIETVVGRSDDFVTLPSGRKVSARAINLLEGVEGILEYQIVQQERDLFVVSVVPIGVLDAPKEEEIERIIQRGCGDEPIRVEVRSTSGIGRSRTGKLRAVVSNVS